MHIDLTLNQKIFPEFYRDFAIFLFRQVKEDIYSLANKKQQNYKIRKMLLDQLGIVDKGILESLDLIQCVTNSIELNFNEGIYLIQLNPRKRIKGTNLKLKQLVRLLEFGTLTFPELPVIRRVFKKYQDGYEELFDDFIEEEFSV